MNTSLLNHKLDILEFVEGLLDGDLVMWIALGVIVAVIMFLALVPAVTGKSFVKSSRERRRAHNRRYHVLWQHERDD
jgi:hypothetical protein